MCYLCGASDLRAICLTKKKGPLSGMACGGQHTDRQQHEINKVLSVKMKEQDHVIMGE